MSIIYEERSSDSPYVETIMCGRTVSDGSTIRPAESHWHMVFVKRKGNVRPLVVGPWSTAGVAAWGEGAEILWIKFKLGAFMPHLPTKKFLDAETALPEGASQSFWLNGSVWQFPDYEHVETFVDRLVRIERSVNNGLEARSGGRSYHGRGPGEALLQRAGWLRRRPRHPG